MKHLQITCRCCGTVQKFLVDDAEAASAQCQYKDAEPTVVFFAEDATGRRVELSFQRGDIGRMESFAMNNTEIAIARGLLKKPGTAGSKKK